MPDVETVYDDPNRCVKDEPNSGPCSCPECKVASVVPSSYIPKGAVITDENLVSVKPQSRVSFHFICPECKKDNIADYMSYCPDCGILIILRSHTVDMFLQTYRALAAKQ